MAYAPGTFSWFECGTTDAAAAKEFYTKVFGWTAVDVPMPGDMPGHYTMLKRGEDDVAGLYQMDGPEFAGVPPHWMSYVTVDDIDQRAAKVEALGGKLLGPPMDIEGVGRMAFVEDNTGGKIAMFKPDGDAGAAQLGPVDGTFGWSELATRDTAAAKTFYGDLFDWTPKTSEIPGIPYTEFVAHGQPVGGMMEMPKEQGDAPPYWMPYVFVDDCDGTMAKVAGAGGTTVVPPMDIPNVGRMGMFSDPTGAMLSVIKMAAAK